jgi:hypothetical protein
MDELTIWREKTPLVKALIPASGDWSWEADPVDPLNVVTAVTLKRNLNRGEAWQQVMFRLGWLSGAIKRGRDRELLEDLTEQLRVLWERNP